MGPGALRHARGLCAGAWRCGARFAGAAAGRVDPRYRLRRRCTDRADRCCRCIGCRDRRRRGDGQGRERQGPRCSVDGRARDDVRRRFRCGVHQRRVALGRATCGRQRWGGAGIETRRALRRRVRRPWQYRGNPGRGAIGSCYAWLSRRADGDELLSDRRGIWRYSRGRRFPRRRLRDHPAPDAVAIRDDGLAQHLSRRLHRQCRGAAGKARAGHRGYPRHAAPGAGRRWRQLELPIMSVYVFMPICPRRAPARQLA